MVFVLVVFVQKAQQARTPCFARFQSPHTRCTRLCSILTTRVRCLYYSIFVPTPPLFLLFSKWSLLQSRVRLLPFFV